MPERHQLAHDADGDFFRAHGADVEPDRRVDAIQRRQRSLVRDALQDPEHLAAAPDHPEVAMRQPRVHVERFLVQAVIVRDHEQPVVARRRELGGRFARLAQDALAAGKARGVVQLFAVVHHDHRKAERLRQRCDRLGHVPGAEHDQPLRRFDRLHEHLHTTTAAHAEIPTEVVDRELGLAALDAARERREHLAFDRASAHGACASPVRVEHEFGARLLGRGARGADHGGERAAPPALEDLGESPRHVAHVGDRSGDSGA